MAGSPVQTTSPDRNEDFNMDSPINLNDSPNPRYSMRSSMRSSMAPRTPNANVRQVSRASRPGVTVPTDDVSIIHAGAGAMGGGGPDSDVESSEAGNMGGVIWGTNVNVDQVQRKFRGFISDFAKDGGAPLYPELIEDAIESQTFCLSLNCADLHAHAPELYLQLVRFPQEVLPSFDIVVNSFSDEHFADLLSDPAQFGAGMAPPDDIWVRPYNLKDVRSMRNMNPMDIDQLVGIRGMVIRASAIIPDIQTAFFRCQLCQNEVEVNIDLGRIVEPGKCNNQQCQGASCMELIHNRSQFQDKQLVKLQETPENIPDGETPQTIDVFCFDALVDGCKPGDRVEVTGLYRAAAIRRNPRRKEVEAVYRTFIDAVHVNKIRNNQLSGNGDSGDAAEETDTERSEEPVDEDAEMGESGNRRRAREAEIRALAADPQIYEKLVNSFAPSIFEMQDAKKGILCQLFGGAKKDFTDVGGGKFRNQMNVLLCGDPGTSKSQLLQYVHKVAPRGIYTSGKGSSAVGLTAYITKDPDSGDLVLESGALVLSDRGICCIDEFDKMSESARSILHEVMEQQTVSIAKAGIICTLNARTSILAAANPIESRYNPRKSVVENIDLPPTLMSRFDLIYLVLDRPNEALDRLLAKHIVSLYYDRDGNEHKDASDAMGRIPNDLFMQYIDYSRRTVSPALTDEACQRLTEAYLELRALGREAGKKVITATPRQLESLIRISEALARMRQSREVLASDVAEALRLHRVATLAAATDPRTGAIDIDAIAVGHTSEQGRELEAQAALMLELLGDYKRRSIRVKALLKKYNDRADQDETGNTRKIDLKELKKVVERLEQAERMRAGEWMQDDPLITIISKEPL